MMTVTICFVLPLIEMATELEPQIGSTRCQSGN